MPAACIPYPARVFDKFLRRQSPLKLGARLAEVAEDAAAVTVSRWKLSKAPKTRRSFLSNAEFMLNLGQE